MTCIKRLQQLTEEQSAGSAAHLRWIQTNAATSCKKSISLWRSFETFEGRCSLLTWVYRVAHHTATAHVIREHRAKLHTLVTLEDIENTLDQTDHRRDSEQRIALERLMRLIHRLRPIDRQLMLLYLEELDGAAIAEITGLLAGHVRTQIHKIKTILARRFHKGQDHE